VTYRALLTEVQELLSRRESERIMEETFRVQRVARNVGRDSFIHWIYGRLRAKRQVLGRVFVVYGGIVFLQ